MPENQNCNLRNNINLITEKYCEKLTAEIEAEGISDKVNEGIRTIHHLVKIKGECEC